jgi:transaldolase
MASKLDQLRSMTVVVADTGDIEAVRRLKPQDCTTNPSLLLKAVENPAYSHLVEEAVAWGRGQAGNPDAVAIAICDRLAVSFGAELANIVPGRVSIEADADLSFDTRATVDKARAIASWSRSRRRSRASGPPKRCSASGSTAISPCCSRWCRRRRAPTRACS